MKRIIVIALIALMTITCGVAGAENSPSLSPSPSPSASTAQASATQSPAPSSGSLTSTTQPDLILLNSTGEEVVRIQMRLRELGYFNFKPTGNYQAMTVDSVIAFQQKQTDSSGLPIMADGTIGTQSEEVLFSPDAQRSDISANIPIGQPLTGEATVTGELVKWSEVKTMLEVNHVYTVTDFNTGVKFSMMFTGGENHAEMECASAADTETFRNVFSGTYNYSKRPVVIDIGGRLVAASLQGYPHGTDTIEGNDMIGHACMFFDGSLSHVGSLPDVEHLNQVYKAAGK